jgi:hypothetical protein
MKSAQSGRLPLPNVPCERRYFHLELLRSHYRNSAGYIVMFDPQFLELPSGTILVAHPNRVSLLLSWRSSRGFHVVRGEIPIEWCGPDHQEELAGALHDFKVAIGLEIFDAEGIERST